MKKVITLAVCGVLLLSSCDTASQGAWNGAAFGSIIGSAIGGIMGGPHGHDVGTLVGVAAGTAIGASAGAISEQQRAEASESGATRRQAARYARAAKQRQLQNISSDNSGYTKDNTYDDRLYDFGNSNGSNTGTEAPATTTSLQIINAHFVDENHDGCLTPNEQAKVVFEIKNSGSNVAYDVLPMVAETTGNKHIQVSDNVHIEHILPGSTVRYAAMVLCDSRVRTGEVCFSVNVHYNGRDVAAPQYFRVNTHR